MKTAHCRCGKTKRFRGNRHRFTCPECLERNRRRARATACLRALISPCSCPRNPFPGYETREERELMELDDLFHDWKDRGCPADHPGALLYE
jgi:hypothetical protein